MHSILPTLYRWLHDVSVDVQQLVPHLKSHAVGLGRFCMEDDQLAGPCTGEWGVAKSVVALRLLG